MKIKKITTINMVVGLLLASATVSAQNLSDANTAFDRANYANALEQYHQMAQTGDKFAQYRYAMMNYFGLGTEKDIVKAYSWMSTAAEDEIAIMKRFQLLIWDEMDRDQQDIGTEQAIHNERFSGTEVMNSRAKAERRKAERSKCTGSRVGNCGAIESFGVSFSNRGRIRAREIPHTMTPAEVEAFEKQYTAMVLNDFTKFDS